MVRRAVFNQDHRAAIVRQDRLSKVSRGLPVALALTCHREKVAVLALDHPKDFHPFALAAGGDLGLLATWRPGAKQRPPLGQGHLIAKKDHRLQLASLLQNRWPGLFLPCLPFSLVLLIVEFVRDKGRLLRREANVMQKPAPSARVVGDPQFALAQHRNQARRPHPPGEARGTRTRFEALIQALALLFIACGLTTSSLNMMSTEPGKATTDKEGKPVVDGSKAQREPSGTIGEGVAVMKASEACGDCVEAEMMESLGELAFEGEALHGGVSKGDGHRSSPS